MDVVALLDDRDATAQQPTSRLYTGFVREHRADDPAALDATWAAVEADQCAGLHAVLLADYEWGARLVGAGLARAVGADAGALRVLMFRDLARLSAVQAGDWTAAQAAAADPGPAGVMDLAPSVDRAAFVHAIGRIHAAIAAGETYQVNYTYRLHGRVYGEPVALYRALRALQPVAYGAFIRLPASDDPRAPTHVLSCSPELFIRREAGVVTARPMKGTASRFTVAEGDSETARMLAEDVKNRAENLMIVDLLRNDLGRIAEIGSVRVPELFAVEPYATVFQMTSTVQARLRADVGFADLLRAVFPCGSITGAPKHHTMDLIADFESTPRGLYCGTLGWVDAPGPGQRCGDFCLSVTIRTLTLRAPATDGTRALHLGVGAGIVQDSRADDEFDECRLKARFVTRLDPGFALLETVLCTADGALPRLPGHLARLQTSAQALGFTLDTARAEAALREAAAACPRGAEHRLRLTLTHAGRIAVQAAPLPPLPANTPLALVIAPQPLPAARPLSAHKTTHRAEYDAGVREAERQGAFDSLFFDPDGGLVEGGRTSVFLRLDGRWWTPAVSDGALPGVARAEVLADRAWAAAERRLTRADLARAEAIMVCNALRGPRAAVLRPGA